MPNDPRQELCEQLTRSARESLVAILEDRRGQATGAGAAIGVPTSIALSPGEEEKQQQLRSTRERQCVWVGVVF